MRKLVIATTNTNKVKRLATLLSDQNFEILSLDDFGIKLDEPDETMNSPMEIATQKALCYINQLPNDTLVLTQDDALVFENVEDADNPGPHIKAPVVERYGKWSDENAIKYYTELTKKYGRKINAYFKYGHAIAIRSDNARKTLRIVAGESKRHIRLVDRINKPETVPGYFLAAIAECEIDGNWIFYNELTHAQSTKADDDLKKSILELLQKLEASNENQK